MNQLRFIKQVIYRLKRRYGVPIQLLRRVSAAVNLETGNKTLVKAYINLRKVIVLPSRMHREFYYDLAFIAAAKNFTYGGHVDVQERRFIIDRADLRGWEVEVGQWFTYQGYRYDIKEVSDFEENLAYYILAKQSIAVAPGDVTEGEASDDIVITEEAES